VASYHVVVLPDGSGLAEVARGLAAVVEGSAVRLLDLALVRCDDVGAVTVTEVSELEGVDELVPQLAMGGELLTERDLELVSLSLGLATTGLVFVTEDRWAGPLSEAAARVGGRIVAGEHIPPSRLRAALVHGDGPGAADDPGADDDPGGG
jgi:hypothetical protein